MTGWRMGSGHGFAQSYFRQNVLPNNHIAFDIIFKLPGKQVKLM